MTECPGERNPFSSSLTSGVVQIGCDSPSGVRHSYRPPHPPYAGDSVYREAGTLAGGDLRSDGARAVLDLSAIPEGSSGSIHVILRVRDSGAPTLFAYRRVIVDLSAP